MPNLPCPSPSSVHLILSSKRSIHHPALAVGAGVEPDEEHVEVDPEFVGELLGACRPDDGSDEAIEGMKRRAASMRNFGFDGWRLASSVAGFDVDELVREGTAPLGLELVQGHTDTGAVGCAEDSVGEVVGPDEGYVESVT